MTKRFDSSPEAPKTIKTLSLFTGAGGLDIGFHDLGFDIVAMVDNDPVACETLRRNCGEGRYFAREVDIHEADINEFDPSILPKGIRFVLGGPPCQTFSAASRRAGGVRGVRDKRGRLFKSYCRILEFLAPVGFLFENVYGLPSAEGGEPWRMIIEAFSSIGYRLFHRILDAADYGVPQFRERVFLVGVKSGSYRFPRPTHGPDSTENAPYVIALEAIEDLQDPSEPYHDFDGQFGHLVAGIPEGLNYSFYTAKMGHPRPVFAWRSKFSDFLYKAARDEPVRTIKAQPGKFSGPLHWKNRHMTIDELKRLQTFPDSYQLHGSHGQKERQIGNCVPPQLARVLAASVRQQIFGYADAPAVETISEDFKLGFRARKLARTKVYRERAKRAIANLDIQPRPIDQLDESSYELVGERPLSLRRGSGSLAPETLTWSVVARVATDPEAGLSLVVSVESSNRGGSPAGEIRAGLSGLSSIGFQFDKVTAIMASDNALDSALLWKIVERELVARSEYLSLLEIYGYYADNSGAITTSLEFKGLPDSPEARVIEHFSHPEHCGVPIPESDLLSLFALDREQLIQSLNRLRQWCYDFRNSQSHQNMKGSHIICAYPFAQLYADFQTQRRLS